METTASEYFSRRVAAYDSLIRRCVPRYDEMQERLVGYFPPAPRRVLELGAGTGNLSVAVAERFPGAELVLVDASPEMLDVARERLGAAHRQPTCVVARFEELPPDLGQFDLVTSSISLHHVADKRTLYARLFERLEPNGALIFADQLRGVDERLHSINWEAWLEFCRAPGHLTADETQSLLDHADAHDHYTPLAEHFALLAESGFVELDCVWRNWIWGIVAARRP